MTKHILALAAFLLGVAVAPAGAQNTQSQDAAQTPEVTVQRTVSWLLENDFKSISRDSISFRVRDPIEGRSRLVDRAGLVGVAQRHLLRSVEDGEECAGEWICDRGPTPYVVEILDVQSERGGFTDITILMTGFGDDRQLDWAREVTVRVARAGAPEVVADRTRHYGE
jgi:hypothetical protein